MLARLVAPCCILVAVLVCANVAFKLASAVNILSAVAVALNAVASVALLSTTLSTSADIVAVVVRFAAAPNVPPRFAVILAVVAKVAAPSYVKSSILSINKSVDVSNLYKNLVFSVLVGTYGDDNPVTVLSPTLYVILSKNTPSINLCGLLSRSFVSPSPKVRLYAFESLVVYSVLPFIFQYNTLDVLLKLT